MDRALCVQFPAWSIDLARRRIGEAPDLLVTTRAGHQQVARAGVQARRDGVRTGMSLAHARALIGLEAKVIDFEPERDRRALRALAMWASRFSPCVGVDDWSLAPDGEPDGLVMDISGCDRLFKGEKRHARQLRQGLDALGLRARIGIGPTIGAAWAMARWGAGRGTEPISICREPREELAPLPVHALRLEADVIAGLRELGVERVQHVLNLPRGGLTTRFGEAVVRRLDQLGGEAIEVIDPVRPLAPVQVERVFDGPTTRLEAVQLAVRGLLEDLHDELLHRESGVCVLELELGRLGVRTGEVVRETIMLSAPSRDVRHLWSLLHPRLERVQMGFGIERVALTVRRGGRLVHRQSERWRRGPTARADEAAGEHLADVLANRLGRVSRLELVDAHLPERSFRYVESPEETEPSTVHLLQRPAVMLDPPEAAEVVALLPDRPPSWMRWRGEAGAVTGFGPERMGRLWWEKPSRAERDYFRVRRDDGLWLWIFRAEHRWFVHGYWF